VEQGTVRKTMAKSVLQAFDVAVGGSRGLTQCR
jgi:hypothetical protein